MHNLLHDDSSAELLKKRAFSCMKCLLPPWPAGFFVCGLNLTLPEDARILKYVLRLCDSFPNVVQRSLPRLLRWLGRQAAETPLNIVASDLVTRNDFVPTVVELNVSKDANETLWQNPCIVWSAPSCVGLWRCNKVSPPLTCGSFGWSVSPKQASVRRPA